MSAQTPAASPPPTPGSRPGALVWVSLLGLASGSALLFLTLRERPFLEMLGNLAGVWGLWVSVVGFGLTFWTIFETRRVSREEQQKTQAAIAAAREETQRAVAAARKETREAVEKIALQLLQDECEAAHRLVSDATKAAQEKNWLRALDRFEEARRMVVLLASFPQLNTGEKQALATGRDDLRITIDHVQERALQQDPSADLPVARWKPLRKLLTLLEDIRARLRRSVLEPPHAD